VLRIKDIHVYRGKTYVLQGVSLQVNHGEIVALIGANGAGKTTLLRTISGLLRPKTGSILFQPQKVTEEIDISRIPPEQIVSLGISHCPEGRGIFAQLSVRENLLVGAYLRKDKKEIQVDYKRVCGIFPLLILDEPSLGLGPIIVDNLFKILTEINAQGVTILLVEQNAVMALDLANRAYVLETGRVTLSGPSRELARDEKVRSAYLGGA